MIECLVLISILLLTKLSNRTDMGSLQPNPSGPYRLLTVNTAPDRAQRLIGRIVADLKDQYSIEHIKNIETKNLHLDSFFSVNPK